MKLTGWYRIERIFDMRKSIILFVIVVFFIGTNISYGFEIDGLKDGMNKDKVIEILSRMNFDKVQDEGSSVKFFLHGKEFDMFYVVNFKNNRLISYHKNFKPSISNYITLFGLLIEQYGMTVKCSSKSDMSSDGESKHLHCTWISKRDWITINYNVLPSHDTLYVYYMVK